jgi:Mrp family chromosome partitioning ATPase
VISALQLTRPNSPSKLILVTSSVAGEGATTLAISFAVYAAQLQRRVLIIGANPLHMPAIGRLEDKVAPPEADAPNDSHVAESIRYAPDLGVDYLPLVGDMPDPAAFLSSEGMSAFLHRLRENYDCVVIDSAPVLGAMETQLLVPLVDKVILAVKWGETPRLVVQNALGILRRATRPDAAGGDAISAVITQVDLKRHARYRFGDSAEMLFRLKPHRNQPLHQAS